MVSVGLDYRFCELSFNSVLARLRPRKVLQIVSKCRSVSMSCVLFEQCFIIELFGLMTASLK